MNRLISPGIYTLILLFAGGVWLMISPFTMQSQPAGASWIASTVNNVAAGGVLAVISLLGLFIYLALALRDAVHTATERMAEQQAEQEAATPATPVH